MTKRLAIEGYSGVQLEVSDEDAQAIKEHLHTHGWEGDLVIASKDGDDEEHINLACTWRIAERNARQDEFFPAHRVVRLHRTGGEHSIAPKERKVAGPGELKENIDEVRTAMPEELPEPPPPARRGRRTPKQEG